MTYQHSVLAHASLALKHTTFLGKVQLLKSYLALKTGTVGKVAINGCTLHVSPGADTSQIFREIFLAEENRFVAEHDDPTIIDAGANIGLCTAYFKMLYPKARILCFEPDRQNYALLHKNIVANHFEHVWLYNCALWEKSGELKLFVRSDIEGGDIGATAFQESRAFFHRSEDIVPETVTAVTLSPYLDEVGEVDYLKMDIEGGEAAVFGEIGERLKRIRQIGMEYHYLPHQNSLGTILKMLEEHGHRYTIWSPLREKDVLDYYTLFIRSTRRKRS